MPAFVHNELQARDGVLNKQKSDTKVSKIHQWTLDFKWWKFKIIIIRISSFSVLTNNFMQILFEIWSTEEYRDLHYKLRW